MPDLVFSSSGSAKVLADQQKLAEGAKAMTALYKQENRELAQLGRDADRAFQGTLSDVEKLQQKAAKLQQVINSTKFTPDEKKQASEALGRINAQIQDIEASSGKAGGTLTEAFGGAKAALLGSFATAAGGAAAAVRLLAAELRAAQDLADRAAATKLTVGQSRNVVIRNLAGVGKKEQQRILGETQKIAADTNVSEQAINAAFAEAYSSSGGDLAASLDTTRTTARFLQDRPGDQGLYAGSLLDLSKVTNTTNAKVNLGLLTKVGALSRVVDPQQQAANVAPALIGATKAGFTAQESAAAFAALTTAGGDFQGARSGTALIALGEQLRAFNPAGLAGLSTGQKLQALQGNRELADQFLADASFEKKSLGVVRSLLTDPNSDAAKSFRANLSQIPGARGLAQIGDRALDFSANKLEPFAASSRAIQAVDEQLAVSAADRLSREDLERVRSILQRTGSSSAASKLETIIAGLSDADPTVSPGEVVPILQRSVRRLRTPTTDSSPVQSQFGNINPVITPPSPEAKRQADLLEDLLNELKRNTRATEDSGGLTATGG